MFARALHQSKAFTACVVAAILIVIAAAESLAQPTVTPMTRVRITLAEQRVLEGEVLRADSATLTVSGLDGPTPVLRANILGIERETSRAAKYAGRTALGLGIVGAVTIGFAAQDFCQSERSSNCGNALLAAGFLGGAFGAAVGGITGAVLGAFFHDWTPTSSLVRVAGPRVGVSAIESCADGPSLRAEVGSARNRQNIARFGIPFFCAGPATLGPEMGQLGWRAVGSGENYQDPGGTWVETRAEDRNALTFNGVFADLPLGHMSFNPRIVGSAAIYRQAHRVSHDTLDTAAYGWSGTAHLDRTNLPGVGLGFALDSPLGRYLSVGAETRAHFIPGALDRRIITTSLSIRVRR
jgi:hypothetical protein